MSFINTGIKPKLVEHKVVDKIIKVQQENKPYNLKIVNSVGTFIFNNLLVISIFTFIFILLLYRYYDVQSRKKKSKIEETSESEEEERDENSEEDE
jgi:hypothetical protein